MLTICHHLAVSMSLEDKANPAVLASLRVNRHNVHKLASHDDIFLALCFYMKGLEIENRVALEKKPKLFAATITSLTEATVADMAL